MPGQFISTEIALIWVIYFAPRALLSGVVPPRLSFRLQAFRQRQTFIFFKTKHTLKQNKLSGYPSAPTVWCVYPQTPIREGGWSRSRTCLWRFCAYTKALLNRLSKICNFRLLYIAVGKSWIFYKASNPINKCNKLQWHKCGGALV